MTEQVAGGIIVPASGRRVACLGVDDLVIVDTHDALLVTTRARSQGGEAPRWKMQGPRMEGPFVIISIFDYIRWNVDPLFYILILVASYFSPCHIYLLRYCGMVDNLIWIHIGTTRRTSSRHLSCRCQCRYQQHTEIFIVKTSPEFGTVAGRATSYIRNSKDGCVRQFQNLAARAWRLAAFKLRLQKGCVKYIGTDCERLIDGLEDEFGSSIVALADLPQESIFVSCPFSLAITAPIAKKALHNVLAPTLATETALDALSERELIATYIVLHHVVLRGETHANEHGDNQLPRWAAPICI